MPLLLLINTDVRRSQQVEVLPDTPGSAAPAWSFMASLRQAIAEEKTEQSKLGRNYEKARLDFLKSHEIILKQARRDRRAVLRLKSGPDGLPGEPISEPGMCAGNCLLPHTALIRNRSLRETQKKEWIDERLRRKEARLRHQPLDPRPGVYPQYPQKYDEYGAINEADDEGDDGLEAQDEDDAAFDAEPETEEAYLQRYHGR